MLKLKNLILATGDCYEAVKIDCAGIKDLLKAIRDEGVIEIQTDGKEIFVNTAYITSFEVCKNLKCV